MTAAIERRLELDADIDDVWRALTDPTELSGWFGDSASLDLKVGGDGWLGWEKHGRFSVRVEVFEPPHRFSWRWSKEADTPIDDGPSTLVEWKLTARDGGGTLLELRESGFTEDKHRQGNEQGWTAELGELVEFLGAA